MIINALFAQINRDNFKITAETTDLKTYYHVNGKLNGKKVHYEDRETDLIPELKNIVLQSHNSSKPNLTGLELYLNLEEFSMADRRYPLKVYDDRTNEFLPISDFATPTMLINDEDAKGLTSVEIMTQLDEQATDPLQLLQPIQIFYGQHVFQVTQVRAFNPTQEINETNPIGLHITPID